jgi:hypothetical protein
MVIDKEKYWLLQPCGVDDSAIIMGVSRDIPDFYHVKECRSASGVYKEAVKLFFSTMYPENIATYDFLDNALGLIIVSKNVRKVFDELGIDYLEYIAAEVYDHQEKRVEREYFILNPLKELPLIDIKKSKIRMSALDATKASKIRNLQIDYDAMEEKDEMFFRSKYDSTNYYVTKELLDAMEVANITAVKAVRADNWNGRRLSLL